MLVRPLHRKTQLHWKCHSNLQSTSQENVTSQKIIFSPLNLIWFPMKWHFSVEVAVSSEVA